MKNQFQKSCFVLLVMAGILGIGRADAQIWKKVKDRVKQTVENHVVNKSGDVTNGAMNKAEKSVVDGAKNTRKNHNSEEGAEDDVAVNKKGISTSSHDKSNYNSYDFVPGDKIIFQPDLSSEADAELPARFAIKKGNAEIQSYEGEKILHLDAGGYVIVAPLMDNESYLPEQFTVEFDMMYENDKDYFASVNDFSVKFYTEEDDNFDGYGLYEFKIHSNEKAVLGGNGTSGQYMPDALKKSVQTNDTWHHIAVYVRKNIAKAYIDQYRVAASNNMPVAAAKLAVKTDGNYGFKIRNFRLAAGGDDKYNKIVTDGKFITHGILFDVNKSTIKPESMGALNEVAKLLKDHTDLNFEIDGHTDSDGADDANMRLSQARADAIRTKLIEMGIDESRLTAKGFGETKPIDENTTAEGKANNRRVEFVRQ